MKKYRILIILFFSLNYPALAQKGQKIIGFNMGGVIPAGGKYDQFNQELPDVAFISGIYFDWNFTRQIGLNLAANNQFSSQIRSNLCPICLENPEYRYYYLDLQVPLNLTINLARKESAAWKTYFLIGYSFDYHLSEWRKDLQTNQVERFNLERDWLWNSSHFINAGLEVRYAFQEDFVLGISPFAKIQLSYETGLPFFGLIFKIGKVL